MLTEKANILFFSEIKGIQDKKSEKTGKNEKNEKNEKGRDLAPIKVASFSLAKNKSSLVLEGLSLSSLSCLHYLLAPSLVFLSLFVSSIAYAVEHPSYESYAKKQEQKSKKLIVPYVTEVNELIKNVLKRQSQPDIKAFKKNVIATAKKQCPLQRQKTKEMFGKDEKGKKDSSVKSPIIIFVSFSMSKESIKGWIKQAKLANASVYIRGLVNNSFKDTAIAVSELVQNQKDQSGGLLIDPNLFKKYSITQVPAVVVVTNDSIFDASFDVVYGDVTLDYALEKISKSRESHENSNVGSCLQKAIEKLRNTNMTSDIEKPVKKSIKEDMKRRRKNA